uniref:BTB domain-containing protein n=1 Tax=Chlamydomonas leiostraca TaxID=1034604 RepID=A0A7S0RRY0_9CHLO|mmetsp:Transcript_28795/g.73392  ORF Transcript_28795/g.73392 Transcript_28795/m.73392 type:complete len:733 (+) Transcript_28795:53-2251(+)
MTKSDSRVFAGKREKTSTQGLKRKLAEAFAQLEPQDSPSRRGPGGPGDGQPSQVAALVDILRQHASGSAATPDKSAVRRAAHQLAELCKQDEFVDQVVTEGAIEVVVPLLNTSADGESTSSSAQEDLEKEACFILGLLAVKPEYQARIAQQGALRGLVRLLREHRPAAITRSQPGSGGAVRRAADAITNLAHENVEIKNMVREQGGIPPLVALLEALDLKVQRAAAGALRTLAFKNEENKNQIVDCGALPILIQMLRSEDVGVHYEAVGVIGNLVHSSQNIKRKVLEEGALQPVISLLSSTCAESQREAALLLGQFATTDADTKAKIVQRGAVPLLVTMLGSTDTSLREMAAFALGRLAQNSDNQAGIVQCGGLVPLLELLESKHYNLQHNAAFALYGLADNEDNIPDIIKVGALQRLMDCSEKLSVQASKDCVQKTITRMEQKLQGRVLSHVVFMLRSGDKLVQQRAAMSLAKLAPEAEIKSIFVDKRGLEVLLDMLVDQALEPRMQREAANAVLELARKINATAPIDCLPAQPTKTVYLGSQYVNNPTLADVTFIVEGRKFHAHRIALLASSDAFRAMFNGGYREKEASSIDIPNIPWEVFEAMMTYIYTGNVEVAPDIATELLQASDQYLLEGLKRLCEMCIAQSLSVDNLAPTFELSEAFSAPQLAKRCVLFALEHYDDITRVLSTPEYYNLMARMVPHLQTSLMEDVGKAAAAAAGGGVAAVDGPAA